MGKIVSLADRKNRRKGVVEIVPKGGAVVEFHAAHSDPQAENFGLTSSPESDQAIILSDAATAAEKAVALRNFSILSAEEAVYWPQVLSLAPDFMTHKDSDLRSAAKRCVLAHSEYISTGRRDVLRRWRGLVEELLSHDKRTNRFVHGYPQTLDILECLSVLGKWRIHDDQDDIVRFFLYLELESQVVTGRKEFSSIATEFLDFCGYNYFLDFYPNAINYLLQQLEGECLPQWEKPHHKVFERLCKLKQHDKITQCLLSAVVRGDLGRVDWFTRNLYPFLFESYIEYERSLIELMTSQAMPQDVRENALISSLFISEEFMLRRKYFKDFVQTVRDVFDADVIETMVLPESHPKIFRILTSHLRLVNG